VFEADWHRPDLASELGFAGVHGRDEVIQDREGVGAGDGVAVKNASSVGQFHALGVDPGDADEAVADGGGDGDQRAPHRRVLARPGRPGHQGVPTDQRDAPVVAVFGAPGEHPPQIHRRTVEDGQCGEVQAGHGIGK
jgi:hypothetical protein